MEKEVKISVHVDGYYGLIKGVPNLIKLFSKYNIKARFYINMGYESFITDYLFKKNKTQEKEVKVNIQRYSKFEKLCMVLLHRGIGHSHPQIIKKIVSGGHEVGIHCWNHFEWSNNFKDFNYKKQIAKCKESYFKILGYFPKYFVAPTWKIDEKIIKELEKQKFEEICSLEKYKYLQKDSRLRWDFLTFEKNIEELLQEGKSKEEILQIYKNQISKNRVSLYFHADYEGIRGLSLFEEVLKMIKEENEK